MTEYTIIESDNTTTLIEKVNSFIKNGWKAYGDLAITTDVRESRMPRIIHTYHQAMIR